MRGQASSVGGNFCPKRQLLPGTVVPACCKDPLFYWVFLLARRLLAFPARGYVPLPAAIVGVLAMMFALGAASSAIDSLFGLISPKQTQATSSGQDQPNLFAFQADAATNSAGTSAGPAAGGGAQISPETMSALLAAQSQSGS